LETSDISESKSNANWRNVTIPPYHPAHSVRFKVDRHRIRPKGESRQATLQINCNSDIAPDLEDFQRAVIKETAQK